MSKISMLNASKFNQINIVASEKPTCGIIASNIYCAINYMQSDSIDVRLILSDQHI